MCTTGSEDAVTIQAGTFSWDRNERPILEKCVCVCACVCVCVCACICGLCMYMRMTVVA